MSRITRRTIIPVNQVTPLTYRDGVTYIQLLTELSDYIKTILHPSLQHTVDQLVADVEHQMDKHHDQYVDGVQEFQRIHDAFMSDVNAKLIALNDGAVTDLVNDESSLLGETMRQVFSTVEKHDELIATTDYRHTTTVDRLNDFERDSQEHRQNMQDEFHTLHNSVNTTLQEQQHEVEQRLKSMQRVTGQTNFVDIVAAKSNVLQLQTRKIGGGNGGAFDISFVNNGGDSHITTTFQNAGESTNDQYHRIFETWRGSASRLTDGYYNVNDRNYQIAPKSNWEFAYYFKPASHPEVSHQWVPEHNNIPTAHYRANPVMRDGNGVIPMHTAAVNDRWVAKDFLELTQRVWVRHPATGDDNLAEVTTTHRYTMDGRIIVSGRLRALRGIIISSGYVLMLPGGESIDTILTSFGNAFERKTDGSIEHLTEETDIGNSYVMLSDTYTNIAHAVKYKNEYETLRWGHPERDDRTGFIEHRTPRIVKIYNQLFPADTLFRAGDVHRFHGEYALADSASMRALLDVK